MKVPPGPYLLEYRAARAAMGAGNIGPSTLIEMLDKGAAFFSDGDRKDFERCPLCSGFLKTHPKSFLKNEVSQLKFRAALADKLVKSGKLTSSKRLLSESGLKFVAVASDGGLCCVMEPNSILWDNFAACAAAKVEAVDIASFLKSF